MGLSQPKMLPAAFMLRHCDQVKLNQFQGEVSGTFFNLYRNNSLIAPNSFLLHLTFRDSNNKFEYPIIPINETTRAIGLYFWFGDISKVEAIIKPISSHLTARTTLAAHEQSCKSMTLHE